MQQKLKDKQPKITKREQSMPAKKLLTFTHSHIHTCTHCTELEIAQTFSMQNTLKTIEKQLSCCWPIQRKNTSWQILHHVPIYNLMQPRHSINVPCFRTTRPGDIQTIFESNNQTNPHSEVLLRGGMPDFRMMRQPLRRGVVASVLKAHPTFVHHPADSTHRRSR